MRLRIHRGADEIGGNCVEIEAQGYSILLDLGLPLQAEQEPSYLPQIDGLTDGSNPNFLAVVLSHTHGDHSGLAGFVHSNYPVLMGNGARSLLLASQAFVTRVQQPRTIATLPPIKTKQPSVSAHFGSHHS